MSREGVHVSLHKTQRSVACLEVGSTDRLAGIALALGEEAGFFSQDVCFARGTREGSDLLRPALEGWRTW